MAMFMLASDYMHSRWVVIGPKCECIKESVLFFWVIHLNWHFKM